LVILDSPDGDHGVTESFIAAGFRLCCNVVMTTAEPHAPRRRSTEVEVRALESDGDWRQALDNQIACMEPEFEVSAYRLHRQHQIDRYRRMANAGIGHWYGAFIGHRLVADLGIFHDRGIGRFQMVQTHPDFRRRGIGSTLVFKSARLALAEDNFDVLVILAEEDSAAQRLYKSIDFVPVERQLGLERWPND
ncbi:MAG: GNAT family N-acetyltransferase, partial [Gammaproteobacteria bacterium]